MSNNNAEQIYDLDRIFRVIISLTLTITLICYVLNSNWFRRIKLGFILPGPPALLLIGNAHLATNTDAIIDIAKGAYENYGAVFRIWVAIEPIFVIIEPKYVQTILASSKHTDKTFFYSFMHNFLGRGLITSSGEVWRLHRRLLQPSFYINVLETFVDSFSESSISLVEKLKTAVAQTDELNIAPFINNCVFDILTETVLGIPINQEGSAYNSSPFRQGKVVTLERIVQPWLLLNCLYNMTKSAKKEDNQKENLNNFTRKIIETKRQERKDGTCRSKQQICLLERMIDIAEQYPEFSNEDIVNEASTFMLAGQESVATSISFCLYFISKYPEIQLRICEELNTVFGNSKRMPSMTDLQELRYLEQCIKETLRLCPSVPVISRVLGENIQIGKHILPTGSNILISSFITQRLSTIYPNPEEFNPDRFISSESEKRPNYSFFPFSAGPRNCIGYKFAMLEMKTVISTILRHFELSEKPDYELKFNFRITLRARGGVWLKLTQN